MRNPRQRYGIREFYKGYKIYSDRWAGGGYPRYIVVPASQKITKETTEHIEPSYYSLKHAKQYISSIAGRSSQIGAEFNPPRPWPAKFYEVIVGNIGKVWEGSNYMQARAKYAAYVKQSKSGQGRAGGEGVTLWKDGEIIAEHHGSLEDEPGYTSNPNYGYDTSPVYNIVETISGQSGRREALVKRSGKVWQFKSKAEAEREADRLNKAMNHPFARPGVTWRGTGTDYRYTVVEEMGDDLANPTVYDSAGKVFAKVGRFRRKAAKIMARAIGGTVGKPKSKNPVQLRFRSKQAAEAYALAHGARAYTIHRVA